MNRLKESQSLLNRLTTDATEGKLPPEWVNLAEFVQATKTENTEIATRKWAAISKTLNDPDTPTFHKSNALYVVPFAVRNGDREKALLILKRALEAEALAYDHMVLNSTLDPLRSDPRFVEIVLQTRKRFETGLQWIEQARSRGEFPRYLEKPLADLLA